VAGTGPLKRVTIWVRDAEASLSLYRDVIGLDVIEDKTLSGPAIAAMVGLQDATLRIVHLAPAGATHGWIGLYALADSTPAVPKTPAPQPSGLTYGQVSVVIPTDAMDRILPKLRERGVRFLTEPKDYVKTTPGDSTPPGRYTEAIFFDPDGVMVSLMGFVPA
jgi:catechol 2,3-dioxygenase-like lactoylglutathione lyase family enzyme